MSNEIEDRYKQCSTDGTEGIKPFKIFGQTSSTSKYFCITHFERIYGVFVVVVVVGAA